MNTQTRTTLTLGSGQEGIDRSKRWRRFAKEHGYGAMNQFVLEAVEWVLGFAVWKKGRGVTGIAKSKNPPLPGDPDAKIGGSTDE